MAAIMHTYTPQTLLGKSVPCNGYSLIELLVTLTIGALLMAVTIPAMTAMLNTQKATSTVNALFVALNLARSEAINATARRLCVSPPMASPAQYRAAGNKDGSCSTTSTTTPCWISEKRVWRSKVRPRMERA